MVPGVLVGQAVTDEVLDLMVSWWLVMGGLFTAACLGAWGRL